MKRCHLLLLLMLMFAIVGCHKKPGANPKSGQDNANTVSFVVEGMT